MFKLCIQKNIHENNYYSFQISRQWNKITFWKIVLMGRLTWVHTCICINCRKFIMLKFYSIRFTIAIDRIDNLTSFFYYDTCIFKSPLKHCLPCRTVIHECNKSGDMGHDHSILHDLSCSIHHQVLFVAGG